MMVTREYIVNELHKLDEKALHKRHGLMKFDIERQQDLENALHYMSLFEAFKKIDEEFRERTTT